MAVVRLVLVSHGCYYQTLHGSGSLWWLVLSDVAPQAACVARRDSVPRAPPEAVLQTQITHMV